MRVVSITLLRFKQGDEHPLILAQACDLSQFGLFQKASVREMLRFFSKTVAERTSPGQRQIVQHEDYNVHVYMQWNGLCGAVFTDLEYPPRVAFVFLSQLLAQFSEQVSNWEQQVQPEVYNSFPPLLDAIVRFQDPAEADKITKIQRDLNETTEILHKTIDELLERGVKLDNLVERSEDLSRQSKLFYKQAKKTNSCCVVM